MHRELAAARLVGRDAADRLERLRARAAPAELALHHEVRLGEIVLHGPELESPVLRDVVRAALRMQHGVPARGHRGLGVDHHRQVLVLDLDQVARVLGDVAVLGDHRRHRFADVAHPIDRHAVLHHRRARELRRRAGHLLRFRAGEDEVHARERLRLRGVDALDAGVRPVAAQHRGVRHAGEHDVVDVLAVAGQQARVLDPLEVLADVLVFLARRLLLPARRNVAFGGNVLRKGRGHFAPSWIISAARWTDSTML